MHNIIIHFCLLFIHKYPISVSQLHPPVAESGQTVTPLLLHQRLLSACLSLCTSPARCPRAAVPRGQSRDQTPELLGVSPLSCPLSRPGPGARPPLAGAGAAREEEEEEEEPSPPVSSARSRGRVWCVAQLRQPRGPRSVPRASLPLRASSRTAGPAGSRSPWCLRPCRCSGRCWRCSGRAVAVPPRRKVRGDCSGGAGSRRWG